MTGTKKILRKTARVLLWILLCLLVLFILLFIFINLPVGRNMVKHRAENYLREKLKTKVVIGSVDYSLPNWLELKNVYFEDQKKDTLIYGEELRVDLNMFKLLRGNTDIKKLYFKNILINISRPANDSVFNYEFVAKAFTGNKSTTPNTDTAALKLSLAHLIFDNVALKFDDRFGGSNFHAGIKALDLTTNLFQPDRLKFGINDLTASGIQFIMTKTAASNMRPIRNPSADTAVTSPFELFITANHIKLRDIDVLTDDKVSGLYYANKVTNLSGSNFLFSIADMRGTADTILLDTSAVIFSAPVAKTEPTKVDSVLPAAKYWFFAAKHLRIQHSNIKYEDNNIAKAGGLDPNHLDTKDVNASINNFLYSKDSTTAMVSRFAFRDTGGFVLDTAHVNFVMTDKVFSATELYLKTPGSLVQNSFLLSYDSLASVNKTPQNSFIAATLNGTVLSFNDLYMVVPALERSLPRSQFANQYLNINTELRGSLARLYLPYFQLSGLSGSRLSGRGILYNLNDADKFSYDIFIDQGHIYKKDFLKFIPPASLAQFRTLPDIIDLKGRIKGDGNNVLADLNASGAGLAFAGVLSFKNLRNPTALVFDASFRSASLTREFIAGFLPPEILKQVQLPSHISGSGKFTADQNNIVMDLKLSTDYGPLTAKGFIKNIKNTKLANYDLLLSSPGFMLGRLLKDTILGDFAGTVVAKGTGFDYTTMRSSIQADIASIQYDHYNYQNAKIDADFSDGLIKSKGRINDNNLKLNYDINANVRGQYPAVMGYVRVDTAKLYPLHLTKDTLNLSLTANIDAKNLQPRNLNASFILDSIKMQNGKNYFNLDSASLIATSSGGVDSIVLRSAFADVHAGGAFDYDKIGPAIANYINGYYKLPGYKPTTTDIPQQQFAVKGTIYESPLIKSFVPGLNNYSDINFAGSYSSANTDSALNFNATVPHISYTTTSVSNGTVAIGSKNGRINYAIKFDTLRTVGNTLYATSINGGAAKDSLSINALTKNSAGVNWFGAAGSAYVSGDTYSFRLQDTLLLNYEKWNVAPDNYIQYSPQGVIVHNFRISSDTATIAINSQQPFPNSPIDVNIDNFNLKSVSSIINQDTVFLAGILDMKATVSDLNKALPAFTGNATITGLEYKQHPLGNLSFNAQKQSDNNVYGELSLVGAGNDLTAKGNYYLNDVNREFDADLQVRQLSVRTIEALSEGQLKGSGGKISGQMDLTGKFSDPHWNGQLNFDTVRFTITQLGTPYFIDKQKIVLSYPNISVPQFTITDSLNNKLVVDGNIRSRSMMDYDLDLDVNANDFILVNAKKTISSQVYGFAAVDVNVYVGGTSAAPDLEGDISFNDKSDVHIVLPQAGYSKNDISTIVRFIDRDTFDVNPPKTGFEPVRTPSAAFAQFLNYNLNISFTKEAALTILLDPSTGDEIKVQGDANLNAGVDPGGHLVLAGTYVLEKGYYDLHYQFLERKFNLIKGSTITFAGEPLQAEVNIVAEYIANTNSNNLLTNEVTDVTPNLANSFRQQIPFHVVLYMTGNLSKPNINFDIQLPENYNLLNNDLRTTLDNKLQQMRSDPATINKQVFSLLLFNRFVSEQSSDFFKGNGSDFNDLARQSVSQFLSSALNEIAADLFKGIDVDLNLNSYNDYSNGGNTERTDLNVAVSKSFANDRLVISVGQNFGVSGNDATAKAGGGNSGFRPDISVAYKLTADGRYLIRAYTKNQFEVVLDGYVVETGLAFVVTMDYNKFKELFRKKKKSTP